MPVRYTPELKQRAVELVLHAQADPATAHGAVTRIANELGLSKESLRVWVRNHNTAPTAPLNPSIWKQKTADYESNSRK
ncbi:transposase [Corynebacterium urinipleomorphum]|uniref:transposase n=1 Tax=Corynebacterium urinipleomorphum TaxID=1852380 RepID=UPI000B351619|nr:transposase [Corynebacterium urinipleomorphum]